MYLFSNSLRIVLKYTLENHRKKSLFEEKIFSLVDEFITNFRSFSFKQNTGMCLWGEKIVLCSDRKVYLVADDGTVEDLGFSHNGGGNFYHPCVVGDKIFMAQSHSTLRKYTRSSSSSSSSSSWERVDFPLVFPWNIRTDFQGEKLYITDGYLKIFSQSGELLQTYESEDEKSLDDFSCMCFGENGEIYVGDWCSRSIKVFAPNKQEKTLIKNIIKPRGIALYEGKLLVSYKTTAVGSDFENGKIGIYDVEDGKFYGDIVLERNRPADLHVFQGRLYICTQDAIVIFNLRKFFAFTENRGAIFPKGNFPCVLDI